MLRNNIPFKVICGYCAIAVILVLAIVLVYSNTQSIIAINEASHEYIWKKEVADSTMSLLLQEEQQNLSNLSDAMDGKETAPNYLQDKAEKLHAGKDSVVVSSKTPQTHEANNTTVEVVKTRKGFFRRLADAFKKEHAETLSVKRDTNHIVVDTVTTPLNVAEDVADILKQIDSKEQHSARSSKKSIDQEMDRLKEVNTQLALRSAQRLSDVHRRERNSLQLAINKAMEAQQHLLWQIMLLAAVAVIAIIILVWRIVCDIRRERIYRESLESANEEIQRVMNQRERLLLTITHDIKAPVASITGFVDFMRTYVHEQQGRECLDNIRHTARHLSQLVTALLDYHQLENGLMKVNPVPFAPVQLARECVKGIRSQAEEKGLEVSLEVTPDKKCDGKEEQEHGNGPVEEREYLGDTFRIRQILDNLLSNAVKYTDKGSVCVTVSMRQYGGKQWLTIGVRDTGKGMDAKEKDKIFQPFCRLKNAQGSEGTGIGLSITRELVNLLGGTLTVESVVGKGSLFTMSLPLRYMEKEKVSSDSGDASSVCPVPANPFRNHKMLVLDDDPLQLQLLREMVRRLETGCQQKGDTWQVFTCTHTTEALTLLHDEQPTLMLMDIEMPEMNGTEMITHISHAQMTVVAMTAHDTSIKKQLLESGFDDCLFKPFGIKELAAVMGMDCPEEGEAHIGTLLAFAGGDAEAEKEILSMVNQELSMHLENIQSALAQDPLPIDEIGEIAHKLLPLAKMMNLPCTEQLIALRPEHIRQLDEAEVRKLLLTLHSCIS